MRFLLSIFVILFSINVSAQELTIKSFTEQTNDLTARSNPRDDLNGNPSALVKVRMAVDNATFKGMVIGDVDYRNGEYYVYMPEGAKRLSVYAPNYLVLDVKFEDYGVGMLVGKTTYLLIINKTGEMEMSTLKNILFQLTPKDATLTLNGAKQNVENGSAKIQLPNGTYRYAVSSKYYQTKEATFTVTDGMDNAPININLEKSKSKLSVSSSPSDAEVFLANKRIGVTPLTDYAVEAGKYNLRIVKNGYDAVSQTLDIVDANPVSVQKNLSSMIHFKVHPVPAHAKVYIDGQLLTGTSPYSVERPAGSYKLKATASEYYDLNTTIVVDGTKQEYRYNLKRKFFKNNGGYIEANAQAGSMSAFGASIGLNIYNVNFEVDYLFGLSKSEEIYWNTLSESVLPSSYTYAPSFMGGKIGYSFCIGNRVQITPQVGAGSVMINGKKLTVGESGAEHDKTYVIKGLAGLRINIAIQKHLGISITPEYSIPIKKGFIYEDLSQTSSKIKAWGSGFNGKIGVNYFF